MAEAIRGALGRAGEVLQPWAMAVGIEGVAMFGIDYALRELKKQKFFATVKKTLKNWTEPVVAIGISLVSLVIAYAELPELATRAVRVIGSWGVYKALLRLLNIEPSMYVDAGTIEVWGLDPNADIEGFVDGSSFAGGSTDSKGYAKIDIPVAIEEGTHKFMLHTKFKAVYSEEYASAHTPTAT